MAQPGKTPGPNPAVNLQVGLSQIMRCYDQAGIKRFHVVPSWDTQAAWTRLATDLAPHDAPLSDADVHVIDSRRENNSASSLSQSARQPAADMTMIQEATSPAAPALTHWELPLLDPAARANRLEEIDSQVRACRLCEELVGYRRQTVFGEGHLQPRVCFYGEAPGADEDAQGRPFVGAAGKLLTDIIYAMGLERSEVYILNSLKCRPPQNRTPLPEEVQACRPFAIAQLEILQPEVIVLLGAVAVRSVLDRAEPVGKLRGRFHPFRGARALVTYHPAYLLRNPAAKKQVWEDMQIIMRELGLQPRPRK